MEKLLEKTYAFKYKIEIYIVTQSVAICKTTRFTIYLLLRPYIKIYCNKTEIVNVIINNP